MWTAETSTGTEADKIASLAVQYLQGSKFLDLGCGRMPVWPCVIGIDDHKTFANATGIKADIRDLSLFTDGSIDACFSSHTLEDFQQDAVPAILAEWWRVLRIGGHLILYLPHPDHYPHPGEEGANPAHQWEPTPNTIIEMMKPIGSWTLLENEVRSGTNEYSFFMVFRKQAPSNPNVHTHQPWERNPGGKKRALVIRLGAIGDMIMASSILPQLRAQGYHVTMNCTPSSYEVVKHDPFVDQWFLQETDLVPNPQLGAFWESLKERYDHIVNLCESVEGSLLTMPGRLTHGYSDEARRNLYGSTSYLARTHDIANVPHTFNPRFYTKKAERQWARKLRAEWTGPQGAPVVLWAIAGSATHKIYPWVAVVIKWLLEKTPAHVVITGDAKIGGALQAAIIDPEKYEGLDTSRVHQMAGEWTIRESLTFAQHVDVVVGPETGVLNAVSFEDRVHKVCYLSHSSKANLTGDWVSTTTLVPEDGMAPCHPCHRLHYGWDHCFKDDKTNAALCASSIRPESVFEAILGGLVAGI